MFSNNDVWEAEHNLRDLDYHHMNSSYIKSRKKSWLLLSITSDVPGLDQIADVSGTMLPTEVIISSENASGPQPQNPGGVYA